MATNQLTSNISHTYAGKEFLTNLFYQPQLEGKDLYREFQFIPDLRDKVNIYLPRRLQKILRADIDCGFTAVGTTTIDDKTITGCKVKFNLEECSDAFDNTIFQEFLKTGTDRNDMIGTVVDTIMQTQTERAVREDNQKLLWFGDDADEDAFYGICDGIWRLLIDASSSLGWSIDMSNDSDIEDGSGVLVADGAQEALEQIWTNQPATLRVINSSDKRFYVTATIWDNYQKTLENTGTDSGLQRLQDGQVRLFYRGVEMFQMPEWDDALADAANPFQAEIGDNAILYTTPDNIVIGADVKDADGEMKVWYDELNELVYRKGKWIQGVQYVEDELMCIAI